MHTGNRMMWAGTGQWLSALFLFPLSCCFVAGGCAWDSMNLFASPPPPPPGDSLVLRGDKLEAAVVPEKGTAAADLAGAHELYRQGEYAKAEKIFHKIAENKKNPPLIAEEARYYEADCLRLQQKYPKASDTYHKLMIDFTSSTYRDQAVQHMYEIANYWLEDTRGEMRLYKEKEDGKRWMVVTPICHWEKAKPFFDEEGRAMEALERVQMNDINGPLADKALFLAGGVKFYREDYKEADHFFSQLVERHPNSPLASQALELAIISKHMSTGGSDYDGRKVAEARQLVDTALRNYPELVAQKTDFLNRQLVGITMQQAEKDFKIADFYRRTGHPGSAYFYYEIVRRRYPGTPFFDKATERMHELRAEVAKKEGEGTPPITPPEKKQIEEAPQPRRLPETAPQPRRLPDASPGQPEEAPPPRRLPALDR